MGAAPVGGRIASVRGLQEPLRQLAERIDDSVNATLEISRHGLTFRTDNDSVEKTSPFRRIAVWSALKLKSKCRGTDHTHAFVPLVANTDNRSEEEKHAELYRYLY